MIILVPTDTLVTTPAEFTVATLVVADTHGLEAAGVPEPVKEVVAPILHRVNEPVMLVANTVTVAVMLQPLSLV